MNTDELRAAADHIVTASQEWPTDEWMSRRTVEASEILARHVQRMYDATPVDEAFAASIAIVISQGDWYYTIAERERECVTLIRWSGGYHLKCGGFSVNERATRGDVRRLCEALGIELREGE